MKMSKNDIVIRLVGNQKNKGLGIYWIISEASHCSSVVLNEFLIPKEFLDVLAEHKIEYEIIKVSQIATFKSGNCPFCKKKLKKIDAHSFTCTCKNFKNKAVSIG